MDHWHEFLPVNQNVLYMVWKKNSMLRNAEEKAEMWIYASSPTIQNEYQTDTIKLSDWTTMTEALGTNVAVQRFTIIQHAHEKCLADRQPNNTISGHTGPSAVVRGPGENVAKA